MKKIAVALSALIAFATPALALAQQPPVRLVLIASKTGPFESSAKETERGVRMGLEYLTQGTMTVLGRKIEFIVKDDQFKPDRSKTLLAEAYAEDKADIAIGTTWSGGALAMAPVASEYRKPLIIEAAQADSLTGSAGSPYIFRASHNATQDVLASAASLKGVDAVAFLAPDYAWGRETVASFKEALQTLHLPARVVQEEYAPQATNDFTAPMQRIFDAFKPVTGRKALVVAWGPGHPMRKLSELSPERFGIELVSMGGPPTLEIMKSWKGLGVQGGTFYHYSFPKNAMNTWFVDEHRKRFNSPPDQFSAGGMVTAAAVIAALKKANSTDSQKLVVAMEDMDFDTIKGPMHMRKEDHQAMQVQYQFRMKKLPVDDWDLLELVREIPASEMPVPVRPRAGG